MTFRIGSYDPKGEPAKLTIDRERVNYWVSQGAQISDTVRTLLKRNQ